MCFLNTSLAQFTNIVQLLCEKNQSLSWFKNCNWIWLIFGTFLALFIRVQIIKLHKILIFIRCIICFLFNVTIHKPLNVGCHIYSERWRQFSNKLNSARQWSVNNSINKGIKVPLMVIVKLKKQNIIINYIKKSTS